MGPEALAQVLRPLAAMFEPASYPNLLRGLDAPDDALVWKLDAERALVHTADFFPPVVDEPHAFGAIAAANALSDIVRDGRHAAVRDQPRRLPRRHGPRASSRRSCAAAPRR